MGDVFISHSVRDDAFATAVLARLETRLAEKRHTPLVDQNDIPPGAEWRPHLIDWLARCDAAVVLLNRKALQSTWVRREVNILMWRRALGARLLVIPVLLDGLSSSAVKDAGLEELRAIQFARTPRGQVPDAESIAELVLAEFADLPEVLCQDDPMSTWLKRLSIYLAEVRERPDALADAARALEIQGEHLARVMDQHGGCLFLAHQFLVASPERMEKAVDALAPSLSDATIRRLTRELEATWVSEKAARGVLPEPGRPPQAMTLLLNARARTTAEQYIRRATCGATRGYEMRSVGSLPTGEDRAGELFRSWENTVWAEFFDADAEDDRWLPEDLHSRTHYLIINDRCPPDHEFAQAVKRLHGAFSWLIVLVTTGTSALEERIRTEFMHAVLLTPLLTAGEEQTARLRNQRLKKLPDLLAGSHA
ncbi:toll/interleukin-1 receptor domain-containing protein [Streptomyces sp. NPDC014793]|uniref:toll/interleukin-1 receptor domain-containing protein n=1 Tax=Streptomyces sp. NPDC014793 TaxID=3364914 RepID=UPI0036FE0DCB